MPPGSTGEAPGAAEISLVAPLSRVPCSLVPKISPGPVAEEASWVFWTTASVQPPACPLPGLGDVGWPHCCSPQWCPVPVPIRRGWGLFLGRSLLFFFAHASCQGCECKGEELQGTLQVGVGCRGRNGTFSKTVVMTHSGFRLFHLEHTVTFLAPHAPGVPEHGVTASPGVRGAEMLEPPPAPVGSGAPTSPIHPANWPQGPQQSCGVIWGEGEARCCLPQLVLISQVH